MMKRIRETVKEIVFSDRAIDALTLAARMTLWWTLAWRLAERHRHRRRQGG